MKSNHRLSRTVAAILSASAAHAVMAANATGPAPAHTASQRGLQLQEVVVTAQRRTQNIQHVPITMEALTGKTLQQLNVQTFSDYVKYLPNVTTGSAGPGNGIIFMRGLSDGVVGAEGQGTVGTFPNVAVYLDDSSALQPGRDLDVYAVDLQRIEVLEGPQGTLFGAGAEAGVVRYITNKPDLYQTEVNVNGGYGITAHGDPNHNMNAVFNWPIIRGRLAARLVWFTDHRGGYINNLPATFTRSSRDVGLVYVNNGVVPPGSVTINNYQIAANGINPLDYGGARLELKYKVNDRWSVLLSEMYQDMNAQGVFYEMPYGSYGPNVGSAQAYVIPGSISPQNPAGVVAGPYHGVALPPLSVNLFNPSYDKDRWENTELRVDGKVGPLSLVYAGVYLDRHTEQLGDYTNYARGRYGYYYQCPYNAKYQLQGCYSPRAAWHDTTHNTHFSQELRISTPSDWRLRGLAGFYYEDYKLYGLTQWNYNTIPQCSPGGATAGCFLPLVTFPGMPYQSGPNGFATHPAFFDDSERTFIQRAVYFSASFDIVPHKLTITAGARYFRMSNSEVGGSMGSFYCEPVTPTSYFGQCLTSNVTDFNPADAGNVNALGPLVNDPHLVFTTTNHLLQTGMRGRANLTWRITPDVMAYYTYSQGFRPGGFNRGTGTYLADVNGNPQWRRPATYLSDNLTNNEIGWKTRWLHNRLQVDGAVYQENWTHTQVQVFCPQCGFGNLTFTTNGANYRVKGVELAIDALPMRGLSVHAAASWNSGEQINAPKLMDNVKGSANFGKPITVYHNSAGQGIPVPNVFGAVGGPLANSPPFQANMRVRYDWVMGAYFPYVQVGFQHRAHSVSPTGEIETDIQPAWTTYDASIGVSRGPWTLSLLGTNLTNVNKSLFTSRRQFIETWTPMRPRVFELTFSYHYASH